MAGKLLPLLLAALAGSLMAVQGAVNSALGKTIGLPRTNLFVQITGAAVAATLLVLPWQAPGSFREITRVPWYTLWGGLLGAVIVFAVAFGVTKVGAGAATTSIIVAQLLTAYLIDHFGLLGVEHVAFSLVKMAGIVLIAGGGWLLLK